MSAMGDSVMGEVTATLKFIKELLQFLIETLMKLEQMHHERVMSDKSLSHNFLKGSTALAATAGKGIKNVVKKKLLSGEIDLKAFSKLSKKTDFVSITLATSKIPEITAYCKKAGIPILTAESGNNISVLAVPSEHKQSIDNMIQFMISRDTNKGQEWAFNKNADFKGLDNNIFHNVINSYDIPTYTFKTQDGAELIAVPKEFQDQYLDAAIQAKETVRDMQNIEIADGFVWDDPNTTAIEVTPLQARQLDEYYKNVKVVDIDGKLYAYGHKDIKQDVDRIIEEDTAIEKSADEWKIAVIDKSITLNKSALLGLEEENTQLIRMPGDKERFIRFNKSELEEIDNGKTLRTKLDYERDYDICDKDGNLIEQSKGDVLVGKFNTRSPFHSQLNESTDKSMYGNFIDRIELFNEKTNKLVSIPIGSFESMYSSLINRADIDEKTAERLTSRIVPKLSEEYTNNVPKEEGRDYSAGRATQNKVKAAIMTQKLKGFTCRNENGETSQDEGFAIIDKRTKEYVFVDKAHWWELDDSLKNMGYNSIEREAVVSKLKQTYNINGEIEHSANVEQTITTVTPALKNIGIMDHNNATSVFNYDPETNKLDYVTIDKEVSTIDFEKICKDHLKIKDDAAIAELTEKIGNKLREPNQIGSSRIDGINYNISQLTSKYIQISNGKDTVTVNKNVLNSDKLTKGFDIAEKSADKLVKNINSSFKTMESLNKDKLSLIKLKTFAAKEIEIRKDKEKIMDAKGQTKSEKTQSSERSL